MTESSFTFLRVRGIPIGAHWSWVVVFALFAWGLGSVVFPHDHPGLDAPTYTAMGIITALLFFASILLHELGHAFQALKEGLRIDGVTLWLFGGVARFAGMFPSAGSEFRIAAAGPVVSAVIALFFGALGLALERLGGPEAVAGVAGYLGRINGILIAFNLVPALPLDGGRILRAWLWHRQRSFAAATIAAARAGQAFGITLIAAGILGLFTSSVQGGIWFVFLGWFLFQAAQAEASFVLVRQAFHNARVRDLMTRNPDVVPPDFTINRFLDAVRLGRGHSTYPVVAGDRPVGLISLQMAGAVPPERRSRTTVAEVMLSGAALPTLSPETPMMNAIDALRTGAGRALVLEDGRLAGIVSASDAARAVEVERARGPLIDSQVRRVGPLIVVLFGVLALAGALFVYRPSVVVVSPGPAVDISGDVTISGVPAEAPSGRFLLTSVNVELDRPTLMVVLLAMVNPERDVLPRSSVVPSGVDEDRFFDEQREVFEESQMIAAAAAARAAGLPVSIAGNGAQVVGIVDGSPADGVLRRGDVIVAVDGRPITTIADVRDRIGTKAAGTRHTLTVERGGANEELGIRSRRLRSGSEDIVGLGIFIETRGLDVDLPFEISFRQREIGGPSAGLAYALTILDMLDPADVARGRTIAVTGTIDVNGEVGPIGGINEKATGARQAGAKLFVVPAVEAGDVRTEGLDVQGVRTLKEALDLLTTAA